MDDTKDIKDTKDVKDTKDTKDKTETSFEEFVESLSHFDADGNGKIKATELRHLLTTLGQPLTEEEVELVMKGHVDYNGYITISDFVRHILDGS